MDPEKDKLIMKPPTTFREQVELYKNRNLNIDNPEHTEKNIIKAMKPICSIAFALCRIKY
ncbi:hypothetical protein [Peribacillus loiseleuriae]|uniref:Uncharacterized protein n=1 Tax=Peribacillus loiseleuriae TaxID=1679170 RepID=A0A0K9GTS0_9BACI|nr:hypothetical protein [Peribacillus loiseleuriae]KMY50055.1 hypothetical protein AC625_11495 [Peribacillus loiseleuriae]